MKNYIKIFISVFFIGYIKYIPGTFASLASVIFFYLLLKFLLLPKILLVLIFLFIFFISIFLINEYSKITDTEDSSVIVIDEFLGVYFIFIFFDLLIIKNEFITLILIFFLFRFFDMYKIFPANIIDNKIKNGFGVIMDDIVAAIYTLVTIYIINVFI